MKKFYIILCSIIFLAGYSYPASKSDNFVPGGELMTVEEMSYIGNRKSHKFHKTTCGTLPYPENRVFLRNRGQAISKGFDRCGNCHP